MSQSRYDEDKLDIVGKIDTIQISNDPGQGVVLRVLSNGTWIYLSEGEAFRLAGLLKEAAHLSERNAGK